MPDLLALGECMIEFFTHESLDTARTFVRAFGGDTLNALAAASRLGTSTGFITRIASDAFGRYLLEGWKREGIDTRFVREGAGFNGVYFIATRPDGEREFTYYRRGSAASELTPGDLEGIDFTGVRAFHTSGITMALSSTARETAREAMSRASRAGCLTSFDLNYRPRLWDPPSAWTAMKEVLPHVSVCFAGIPEDTEALLGTVDLEEAAERLHEAGAPTVVLKLGAKGAWIFRGNERISLQALTAGPVLDTTGAGDAFAGGCLHGLLSGHSIEQAGRIGTVCAGLKILGRGAIESLPEGKLVFDRLLPPKEISRD